ncbi:MAG: SDR family NAD(P)-dependent oxidoreductase [Parvibaculales bacterium]
MAYEDIRDKSVIVTAAGNGIGKASALEFARAGAKVVVNDIDAALAQATVDDITAFGGTATAVAADVTQQAQVKTLVAEAVSRHGGLDVMFNNAGGAMPMPFHQTPMETHEQIVALNFNSVLYGSLAALDIMLEQGHGVILATSSGAGLGAVNGLATYGAAKAAINSLMGSLAAEYGRAGIRACSICAGAMDTPGLRMWAETLEGGLAGFNAKQPSGRVGTAEEIAEVAVFLSSHHARFINGATVPVDGAVHALLAAPV